MYRSCAHRIRSQCEFRSPLCHRGHHAVLGVLCPEQELPAKRVPAPGAPVTKLWSPGLYPKNRGSYISSRKDPHAPAMTICCWELGYLAELCSLVVPQYLHLKNGKNNIFLKRVVVRRRGLDAQNAFRTVSKAWEMLKEHGKYLKD